MENSVLVLHWEMESNKCNRLNVTGVSFALLQQYPSMDVNYDKKNLTAMSGSRGKNA